MELRNKKVQHILYCFNVAVPGNLLQASRRKRQPPEVASKFQPSEWLLTEGLTVP